MFWHCCRLLSGPAYPITWGLLAVAILTLLSGMAGAVWLDCQRLWRKDSGLSIDRLDESAWPGARVIFPVMAALAAGLLLFVLKAGTGADGLVPDFDLAIENYQHSLTDFRPNVPSTSLETVLTAYLEHGMPLYVGLRAARLQTPGRPLRALGRWYPGHLYVVSRSKGGCDVYVEAGQWIFIA